MAAKPPDFVETALLAETLLPLLGVVLPGQEEGPAMRGRQRGGGALPPVGQLLQNKCMHLDGVKQRLSAMYSEGAAEADGAQGYGGRPSAATLGHPSPPKSKMMITSPLVSRRHGLSRSPTRSLLPGTSMHLGEEEWISGSKEELKGEDGPVLLLPPSLQTLATSLSPRRARRGKH